jgi:capsular exopolysaccharide synthesis family protein
MTIFDKTLMATAPDEARDDELETAGAAPPQTTSAIATAPSRRLRPRGRADAALTVFARTVPAQLPTAAEREARRLVNAIDQEAPVLDQLRSLATTLHQAHTDRELSVLTITSSIGGEGKTLLAANLALTLSRSYKRQVLLIDADLRRPGLHRVFGCPSEDGVRTALDAIHSGAPVSVQEVAPRLALLPAGKRARDPISVFASDTMHRLVADAAASFDWVIIDTPPVGMLPDVNLVAGLSDGVILVVEAGRVRYDLVQRSVESIGADRIIGVVLNKIPEHDMVSSYGMHYYSPYHGKPPGVGD